jgi:hypothetical protein
MAPDVGIGIHGIRIAARVFEVVLQTLPSDRSTTSASPRESANRKGDTRRQRDYITVSCKRYCLGLGMSGRDPSSTHVPIRAQGGDGLRSGLIHQQAKLSR